MLKVMQEEGVGEPTKGGKGGPPMAWTWGVEGRSQGWLLVWVRRAREVNAGD